jgi:adenine phosphoribosyltransferase
MWNGNRHAGFPLQGFSEDFGQYCRTIENFPKDNISFKDITPLLADNRAFRQSILKMCQPFYGKIDSIVCIEARGFLIGSAMAFNLCCGLIPVRKSGKLPYSVIRTEYEKEYGTDSLEIHADAIHPDQKILIVDDVLATGGTSKAIVDLVRRMHGNVIGCAFLGEITALKGRLKLDCPINSLITF